MLDISTVVITWEYPLASNFIIYYHVSSPGSAPLRISVPELIVTRMQQAAFKGQSTIEITVGPDEVFMCIDSIDPPEDDTYIYEIIEEQ